MVKKTSFELDSSLVRLKCVFIIKPPPQPRAPNTVHILHSISMIFPVQSAKLFDYIPQRRTQIPRFSEHRRHWQVRGSTVQRFWEPAAEQPCKRPWKYIINYQLTISELPQDSISNKRPKGHVRSYWYENKSDFHKNDFSLNLIWKWECLEIGNGQFPSWWITIWMWHIKGAWWAIWLGSTTPYRYWKYLASLSWVFLGVAKTIVSSLLCCDVGIVQRPFNLLYYVTWWLHSSASPKKYESLYVSSKLPTYPSPNPTFCPKWEVCVNVGLGDG